MYEILYKGIHQKQEYDNIIKKVITQCFNQEQLEKEKLWLTIVLTNSDNIQKVNKQYRNIDKATDVLSFPLGENGVYDVNLDTGAKMLGDIVISMEKAVEQAKLYNHPLQREIGFLTVHSMLHLLGYDHMAPEEATVMEQKQEEILNRLGITRKE